ncbi:alkaline shock response membrane anchor protein AmaP [Streptomyces sp. WSLK1-5]|uniref:alkaline shock response membrane anchor protein AmaP n=1 Tax=unclassified Streptomyces TaxID=2593676 RepID=UPI0021AD5010|nr:alkaline shock response membrane anchor protein AmaP [Streptomyces sp. RP5T]
MPRTRGVADRAALGVVGLVFLLAGSWLAATDRAVAGRLPSWWPAPREDGVLLDPERLTRWRGEGWWTPTVVAAAIALTLLFAYGALTRLRSGPAGRVDLPAPGGTVRPQALAEALAVRVSALPGIARDRAHVRTRRGQRLEIGLRVWLEPDTPPDAVLPGLRAVTTEAAQAAAPYEVRARVRLSAVSHRMPHVR